MLERLGHPVDPAVHHRISLESAAKGGAALGGGPAFKADPRTSKLLNRAISDPGHTLLFGPPGTGKSTAARYAFEQAGVPYVRISCHPGMDADEFIGTVEAKVSPEGRQLFEAKWGPMVVAAEQGTGIILEEVNALLPERSFALFSLLDDSRNFLAQVCGSERWIEKHPGFKVIGTANDNGTGEHMAMYAGIQVMNSALRDRFSRQICIPYLTEPEEVGMLMERTGISESKAKLMVALASETRSRAAKGEGVDAISPRSLIAWAQSCVGSVSHGDNLTWWDTAEITIANRQESHNRVVLQKMVTDRFTGDVIRM
jgi:MoxR-like ATPase